MPSRGRRSKQAISMRHCFAFVLVLFLVRATASSHVFSVGSASSEDPNACGPHSVGLVDGDTAKWVAGSCIQADEWADDAETATALESEVVVVYVNPGLGADTHFYFVDFASKNVSKVLIGGDQGELRCVGTAGKLLCYGISPGDGDDATQLIQVNARTGDSKPVLNLTDYEGFSVGGSVIDPINMFYHFIAVGEPHLLAPPAARADLPSAASLSWPNELYRRCKRGARCPPSPSSRTANGTEPSDQWLVTIDLKRMAVVAEAPLSRNFMGPLSVSEAHVRVLARHHVLLRLPLNNK
jgi:hypothetical protein